MLAIGPDGQPIEGAPVIGPDGQPIPIAEAAPVEPEPEVILIVCVCVCVCHCLQLRIAKDDYLCHISHRNQRHLHHHLNSDSTYHRKVSLQPETNFRHIFISICFTICGHPKVLRFHS